MAVDERDREDYFKSSFYKKEHEHRTGGRLDLPLPGVLAAAVVYVVMVDNENFENEVGGYSARK